MEKQSEQKVETQETTNVETINSNYEVETPETTEQSQSEKAMDNMLDEMFEPKNKETEEKPEETPKEETSTEETEPEEKKPEEKTDERIDDEALPISLKTTTRDGEEVTETFDFNTEEGRNKVIQYAQKGRHYEREMEALNENRKALDSDQRMTNEAMTKNAFVTLWLQSRGEVTTNDLVELPFEEFEGSSAKLDNEGNIIEQGSREADIRNWNAHTAQVKEARQKLKDFVNNSQRHSAEIETAQNEFFSNHPEIQDKGKWLEENIQPYYDAIISFNYHPMPKDFMEMIHFWKNKDTIINEKVKAERIKKAKIKFEPTPSELSPNLKRDDVIKSAMDKEVDEMFK